jgi:uncharacterized protein
MSRLVFFISFLAVSTWQANAQDEIHHSNPLSNSIFWEVSHPKRNQQIYIFGTHHLHDYQFIEKNEIIQSKLKSADIVVGEMVIGGNEMQMMMKMVNVMYMKGKTLDQLMKPEDYEATNKCLRENMGLSLATLNNVKPIFIYQLIMVAKFMKTQPKSTVVTNAQSLENSMDGYFQQKGKEMEKEIRGLETVDEQLKALYDGYSLDRQIQMLLQMVHDKDGVSTQEIHTLNDYYNKQDLQGLLQLMQKTATPEELDALLISRNQKWIPQLESIFESGKSAFVAVGAGHLPGDFGVLSLLVSKGYQIKPITIAVE